VRTNERGKHIRILNVGVVDLTTNGPTTALYARVMNANLASIMPQAVSVWCERRGHRVTFVCYTGFEDLVAELPKDVDVLILSAYTETAQLAYAVSALFRSRGAITVLGGPHARCYPQDAQRYFDYVLGFTDESVIGDLLAEAEPHRPLGRRMAALKQPHALPGVRERWKFAEPTIRKAPLFQMVPMIASLGCPYTCSFCIDSEVPYQALELQDTKDDLAFLLTKYRRPVVGWHDPNFGVRFDATMTAIEEAVPAGRRITFLAESSLALLAEPNLVRLAKNGFQALLPGIESWYEMGNKSKTGGSSGIAKVEAVADHANRILRHIPYVQANFVLGLDSDEGDEPFELTKRFVDLAPGVFPGYSLLSVFGQAAPLNLSYQRAGRVLPFPFHFLNCNHAMNVKPLHYEWPDFYGKVADLTRHTFSWRAIANRMRATGGTIPRIMNLVRAVSQQGFGRLKWLRRVKRLLETDAAFRAYFEGTSNVLPRLFADRVRKDLGPMWPWLPKGGLDYDPNAYLAEETARAHARAPAGRALAAASAF
jgi:hypothetical protein